ncbi:MAG: S8 family serine peptidase [Thermodesulfobacteriota bacterium]|nr:S8 family serine peptidase [Thermodesulfobacteriota bacterium]
MRRLFFIFIFGLLLLFIRHEIWAKQNEVNYVPGELIVKFLDLSVYPDTYLTSSFDEFQKKMETLGLISFKQFMADSLPFRNSNRGLNSLRLKRLSRIYKARFPAQRDLFKIIKELKKSPIVEYVEPNYIFKVCTTPNDPYFNNQWALHNTGQTGGVNDADIDAIEAWDIEQGDPGVIIAIIDTGVEYDHEDLAGNIWQNPGEIPDDEIDNDGNGYIDDIIGWDFVDTTDTECAFGEDCQDWDNDPMDKQGHGTHVAGITAAASDNSIGIAGIAWNCTIMPVRAGYETPSGNGSLENDDSAAAIVYAVENGASVINLSWGGYQKSNLVEDAITFATESGVLICAAAGNEETSDPLYPAALDNHAIIAVGATDDSDLFAVAFSNFGDWVDVSAPGDAIYSTYLNDSYIELSGTSMATPVTAGVAALLSSYFPSLSSFELKARIMRSVDVLGSLNGKNITSGRINLYSALIDTYTTPHILSVTPNAAHETEQLTLFGDRFGSVQGSGYVSFPPGIEAPILSWSNSVIVCEVPIGADTGDLTVTTSEGTSNGFGFTVLIPFYYETLIGNEFLGAGVAQGWRADDQSWSYDLPFTFPFFGQDYDSMFICSNGFIDFTDSTQSASNSDEELIKRVIIAPLWDDLVTNGTSQTGEDIYIYSPTSDSLSIRWAGELYETSEPVNVEAILYEDGRIKFNYGTGNTNLTPTIGISGGGNDTYHFSTYNNQRGLNQVQTVLFTPNQPPVADGGPDQIVEEGVIVTLDASNSDDPDGSITSYLWEQTGGTIVTLSDSGAVMPTFTALDIGPAGDSLIFRLTVTDNGGLQDDDTCIVDVTWVDIGPPTAYAGGDQTVNDGALVALDGSGSNDPDPDDTLSYLWAQTAGTSVTLSNSTIVSPVFIAPEVGIGGETLTFELTVTDQNTSQSIDTCNVKVTWEDDPPIANAGFNQTIDEGTVVTLNGSGSYDPDPGDGISSYQWTQLDEVGVTLSDSSVAMPTFTAPDVGPGGEILIFRLIVKDNSAQQSTDTCVVNVRWIDLEFPVANAGPDQTVDEGTVVTLNGSGSYDPDPGDGISSYQWTQLDGAGVTLSDSSVAMPTFTALDVGPGGETLTFQLKVTDKGGLQSTDTIVVNIRWQNNPPIADAGSDQTVDEGDTVVLDGSGSIDIDDGISSYQWTQLDGAGVTLSDSSVAMPTFTALDVGPGGETLTFQLKVTDKGGLQSIDTIVVNIRWQNNPPIADAGSDQTVDEGDTVVLDGSGSTDMDDGIDSYLWTQIDGQEVTLSDKQAVNSTFIAPDVGSDGGSLTFQLKVTDKGGLRSVDDCTIQLTSTDSDGNGGGGDDDGGSDFCFIATAAFGSKLEPSVIILRDFRDMYLLKNRLGQSVVSFYYRFSPPLAKSIEKHDTLKACVRVGLMPLVFAVSFIMNSSILEKIIVFVSLPVLFWRIGVYFYYTRRKRAVA